MRTLVPALLALLVLMPAVSQADHMQQQMHRVDVQIREFAYSPAQIQVPYAKVPFVLHLDNDGLLPHTVQVDMVYRNQAVGSYARVTVPSQGEVALPMPVYQYQSPYVQICKPEYGEQCFVVPLQDITFRFHDPEYPQFGMRGAIVLTR